MAPSEGGRSAIVLWEWVRAGCTPLRARCATLHARRRFVRATSSALPASPPLRRAGSFLGDNFADKPLLERLNWIHVPMLSLTPLIALYGLATVRSDPRTWAFAFVYYFLTGLGITAGAWTGGRARRPLHLRAHHRALSATRAGSGLMTSRPHTSSSHLLPSCLLSSHARAGYHRLFAHRCYSATWPLRALLIALGSGAVEGSVRWWSRDHRAHHRYVDTDKDPYSAAKGFWYAHIGWMLVKQDKTRIGKAEITGV